jgi:hypothetical protein
MVWNASDIFKRNGWYEPVKLILHEPIDDEAYIRLRAALNWDEEAVRFYEEIHILALCRKGKIWSSDDGEREIAILGFKDDDVQKLQKMYPNDDFNQYGWSSLQPYNIFRAGIVYCHDPKTLDLVLTTILGCRRHPSLFTKGAYTTIKGIVLCNGLSQGTSLEVGIHLTPQEARLKFEQYYEEKTVFDKVEVLVPYYDSDTPNETVKSVSYLMLMMIDIPLDQICAIRRNGLMTKQEAGYPSNRN